MSRKEKRGRRDDLSDSELEKKVIGVEPGLDSDSEEDERRKGKKPAKRKVRTRKVCFKDKGNKKKEGQEKVDELTRKLLQLNIKDGTYATAYVQLFVLAPEMTKNLPLPSYFVASTIALMSTTVTPSHPRYPQSNTPMP